MDEASASSVVLLTALPLAGILIIDGLGGHRVGEVLAAVITASVVGVPLLLNDLRRALRARWASDPSDEPTSTD